MQAHCACMVFTAYRLILIHVMLTKSHPSGAITVAAPAPAATKLKSLTDNCA